MKIYLAWIADSSLTLSMRPSSQTLELSSVYSLHSLHSVSLISTLRVKTDFIEKSIFLSSQWLWLVCLATLLSRELLSSGLRQHFSSLSVSQTGSGQASGGAWSAEAKYFCIQSQAVPGVQETLRKSGVPLPNPIIDLNLMHRCNAMKERKKEETLHCTVAG